MLREWKNAASSYDIDRSMKLKYGNLGATQRDDAPERFCFDHWRAWIYWLELGEENRTGGECSSVQGQCFVEAKKNILLDNQGHNEENNLKDHFLKHGVDLHIKIGDISCEKFVNSVLCQKNEITSIFHLASAMSGQCEKDFDLGIQTNLLGTLNLLNATRHCTNAATFVFSSTGAVFGRGKLVSSGDRGKLFCPTDGTKFLPETTYGMTKSCCEALVNDYNRRGFLTGRSARLPTVVRQESQMLPPLVYFLALYASH